MYGPESCATVAIQLEPSADNPTGIVVINASDFDEATMTKAATPEQQAPQNQQTEQTPAPEGGEKKVVAPWAAQ